MSLVDSDADFAIGIDVGGTNMRAARISPSGAILDKVAIAGSREPCQAFDLIVGLARQMGTGEARAIGIGIPGRVDGHTGKVVSGGFLDLSSIDVKGELARHFALPVAVANDCSMALVGEARCGAGRGADTIAMLTIGTGIGGAIIEAGRLVHGRAHAGQLGHLVVQAGGEPCLCGQRGCVEAYSSGTALGRHLREAGYGSDVRFEALAAWADAGDETARTVLQNWAGPLQMAIHTLAATLDPDRVLIGGGMGAAALRALAFLPQIKTWYRTDVRPALLGDDAGVIGAGLAALDLVHVPVRQSATSRATKRLVMVNGVPASGKSRLAQEIAQKTNWPLLALDTIKNPFLELIEGVDRDFNRLLGRASYKAIFSTISEAAPGATFIVDAWFGFQPIELLRQHIAMAGIDEIVELWCHAPGETLRQRYLSRCGERLPGHPGASYANELVELAKRAKPCQLGCLYEIDTTVPVQIEAVLDWIAKQFA